MSDQASRSNTVRVKAVRTFEGPEGFKHSGSEPFEVSGDRAADLKRNGLVTIEGEPSPEPTAPVGGMTTDPDPERERTDDATFGVADTGRVARNPGRRKG